MNHAYRAGGTDSTGFDEIAREFGDCLCGVYSTGFSVVEIARLIGCRKAISVYRILQRRGVIDSSLKRSRFSGTPELENALRRTGLSFAQWCNSWRFDPKTAQEKLSKADTLAGPEFWQAVRRDFPRLCGKDTGPVDLEEWEVKVASLTTAYSFLIDWDQKHERFVGTIPGVESLTIAGTHPSVVMSDLVRAAWLLKAIEVLDEVMERRA